MRTIMKTLATVLALALAMPALAQEAAGSEPIAARDAAAPTEPDPDRLEAAGRVINRIWPLGTYRRIMESTMNTATSGVTTPLWAPEGSKEARRAQHEARTGRPLPGETDAEATRASVEAGMAQLTSALASTFERVEPGIRSAMTRVYARRYSLTELNELDAFFATPTGSRYAADSITLMNDPEMVAAMAEMIDDVAGADTAEAAAEAAAAAADAAASAAAAYPTSKF